MKPYICSAQRNICAITEALVAYEKCDVLFGLVAYRDHPPVCPTFLTKKFKFTSSVSKMRRNVDTLKTGSGGDDPEGLCCALYDALHMDWRKGSTKVVVLVTDAPPHGLGERGDRFPGGCPDGHDPIVTAHSMAEAGICLYTVGCEPKLSSSFHWFTKDFMVAIANITGGQAVSLSSSQHLVGVILGSTQEEIALENLMGQFEVEKKAAVALIGRSRVAEGKSYGIEDKKDAGFEAYHEELVGAIHGSMSTRRVQTKRLEHDASITAPHATSLMCVADLAEWRTIKPCMAFAQKPTPSIPATQVNVSMGGITSEQVKRMAGKSMSRAALKEGTE